MLSVLAYMIHLDPWMALIAIAIFVPQLVFVPLLQRAIIERTAARVQVLARLSAGATRFDSGSGIWNLHEAVGSVSLDGAITSWLRVRAWSMLRAPILEQGALPAAASVGGAAGLSIAGAI